MQNSIYKIKYLLFLSWDWEAWCLTVWRVIPAPPERNTAWNKGRKCFHCLGAPNNLIRPWMAWHRSHGSRNLCISRARLHTASISVPGYRHRSMRWDANMSVCRTGVKVPHVTVLLQLRMTPCLNQTTSNVFSDKPQDIFTCICTKCIKWSHEREIISFCISAHIFPVRYSWKDPEKCWYWKSTLKTVEKI